MWFFTGIRSEAAIPSADTYLPQGPLWPASDPLKQPAWLTSAVDEWEHE